MIITALGHAGLDVRTSNARVLIDPWLSPEGAFQAAWFQYPDNSHLLTESLLRPTAIVISHEHLDHVDPWFLSHVPRDIPAIIPRYPAPALRQKIELGGRRPIVEVEQWQVVEIAPGMSVFFVSEPPMNHDSAIMIQGDDAVLLDMNDARLFPVQLREIRQKLGGHIDAFAFQGAGASWYPMCYAYPAGKRAELSKRKRLAKLAYCRKCIQIVEPTVALPFAGPPAFLDPELFQFNSEMDDGIFPDQQQVADWLRGKGVEQSLVLLPGDAWDTRTREKRGDPHWRGFSFDSRGDYLTEYRSRRATQIDTVRKRHPHPTTSLRPAFGGYFTDLLHMSPYFNARIAMRVGFEITGPGGGSWHVDFRPGREGVGDGIEECGYIYRFESRWLPPLLNGTVPWEDFFLSLRFSARRDPDRYNDHLLGLLKFAEPAALAEVEAFETAARGDERITVHSEGQVYSVSRYCPHAGNDLLHTGEVLPGGILRCLAHHYEFDLETGRCISGNCEPLQTRRVTGALEGADRQEAEPGADMAS